MESFSPSLPLARGVNSSSLLSIFHLLPFLPGYLSLSSFRSFGCYNLRPLHPPLLGPSLPFVIARCLSFLTVMSMLVSSVLPLPAMTHPSFLVHYFYPELASSSLPCPRSLPSFSITAFLLRFSLTTLKGAQQGGLFLSGSFKLCLRVFMLCGFSSLTPSILFLPVLSGCIYIFIPPVCPTFFFFHRPPPFLPR